jgi:DNA polymerase III sliding clamp (beta) subunit (PCNA family)
MNLSINCLSIEVKINSTELFDVRIITHKLAVCEIKDNSIKKNWPELYFRRIQVMVIRFFNLLTKLFFSSSFHK